MPRIFGRRYRMNVIFKAFMKNLFGASYERVARTFFIYLIVFWGLHIADVKIEIAPSILYLMVTVFTAGVMWQALSSETNMAQLQKIRMLPFEKWKLFFCYIAAMGSYVFLTKTAALLTVLLAVSDWSLREFSGSILCAGIAILMMPAFYFLKLQMISENENRQAVKRHRNYSVWRYFFRYLRTHKNYLMNMGIMYGVACVLPLVFRGMEIAFVVPFGFVILSMNTPLGIFLSCDPALERAVHVLPAPGKRFCVPYSLFIFLCNMIAETIFLCSLQIQMGGVTFQMIMIAVVVALSSAVCSVLLEWFCPIRGWKLECDLWHHPRKYLVPAGMLLLLTLAG